MSNTTTQNLGVVTAYGYAKSKGYSGTEEQFAQELAALGNYTNLLAIAYSASSTYAVGDFCLYNSKLYRCVSTIYIAEAWNSSHWEEVTVGSEIKRLDERIDSAHQEMYQFGITESVSGNLVHFTDGANSLTFKSISIPLSPVQSFNGYDKPWAGGAGKNLLHIFINTDGKTTNGITYTVDVDTGTVTANGTATANADIIITDSTIDLPNGTYVLSGGISANQWIRIQVDGTLYQSSGSDSNSFTVTDDTVFGNCYCRVVSGQTVSGAVFKPMIRLASEADETFAPYENICPITGHDSVTITRTGRNFISTPTSSLTQNGITYTPMEDGSVHVEGTSTGTSYFNFSTWGAKLAPIMEKAGVELIMSGGTSDVLFYTQYRRTGSTSNVTLGLDNGSGASFTVPDDLDNYAIYLRVNSGKTIDTTVYPMLRLASDTDATFEPYTGTTYPVSFSSAGTVCGGTVDVVSGVLTVDTVTAQIGSYNWTDRIGSQGRVYTLATNILPSAPYVYDSFASLSADGKNLCDKLPMTNTVSNPDSASITIGVNEYIYLNGVTHIDASVTDKASLNTWLTANPLQVTFRLATPQTYQLTPAQVTTLLGTNNVWNDVGTMSVEYPADIKLYIDSRLQS